MLFRHIRRTAGPKNNGPAAGWYVFTDKYYSETTSKGISTFTSRWRLMVAV